MSARKVDHQKFQDLDIQILGISANDSFSQKTFADSLQLPYPLLSDHPELKVIRSYGGVRQFPKDPSRQVAWRSFFLIDKEGIVRGRWRAEDAEVFPSDTILQVGREIAAKR